MGTPTPPGESGLDAVDVTSELNEFSYLKMFYYST